MEGILSNNTARICPRDAKVVFVHREFRHLTCPICALGGLSQGYAEKLKEKGMVKVNLKGEDISKVRRQQFEVRLLELLQSQRVDGLPCHAARKTWATSIVCNPVSTVLRGEQTVAISTARGDANPKNFPKTIFAGCPLNADSASAEPRIPA